MKYIRLLMFLFILIILNASCNKDDKDGFNYYGKWTAVKAVPSTGGFVQRKYDLTLSRMNKFNESFFTESGWTIKNYEFVSIDGTFVVLENQMQFNVQKISISKYYSSINYIDSPYSIISDSVNIGNKLQEFIKATSGHTATFSLNGNNLTLSVDYDENGNYEDEDEILIYNRQ